MLLSELGEEWRPGIEQLAHRLAILTIAFVVGMPDVNVDEPDSALKVFSQQPSGLALPLHHAPSSTEL